MRVNGFVLHGAAAAAVFASGVGAAIAGSSAGGVTLAGPQVLRLIQNSPAALSSYPALNVTMTFTVRARGRHVTVHERGVMTPDGKTGRLEVNLPNGAAPLSVLAKDDAMYVPATQHASAMFGKRWIGLRITSPAGASSFNNPTGADALSYLRLMPGATGDVKVLGHQTIDRVRTTHYRVTIDLLKAEQSTPPEFRQASAAQLQQLGISTMPVDVWLDAQNVVRQQKFMTTTHGVSVEVLVQISGSATPVDVVAPAASDVHFVDTAAELFLDAVNR